MQPIKERQKQQKQSFTHQSSVSKSQKKTFWLGLSTAVVLIFGAWSLYPSAAASDDMSDAEKQKIQDSFNALGAVPIKKISTDTEKELAISSLQIGEEEKEAISKQSKNGSVELVWLQAWDYLAEDGDTLKFETSEYKVTTSLTNKPVMFALPVNTGTAQQIKVTGIHDGGGGITASIMTEAGAVTTPVITEGSTFTLSVR